MSNATTSTHVTATSRKESAQREADARYRRAERKSIKLSMQVVGDPTLRAKTIVEVRGISSLLSGKYYVTDVKHNISNSGYVCDLKLIRDGTGRRSRRLAQELRGERNTSSPKPAGRLIELDKINPDTGTTELRYIREEGAIGSGDPEERGR